MQQPFNTPAGAVSHDSARAHTWRGVHVEANPACQRTVTDLLLDQASARPDAPAFSEPAPGSAFHTLNFGQVNSLTQSAAAWLDDVAGGRPGRSIALMPVNDLRSVVAILGAIRWGAPILLLDPAAPAARNAILMAAMGIDRAVNCSVTSAGVESHRFPALGDLPMRFWPRPDRHPSDDAFYVPTSGSTAVSKIVAQTHRGTVSNALAVRQHHQLKPGDRFLGCLPIHHVNGLHFTVIGALICGSHSLLPAGFDPFAYPKWMASFKPHVASIVPSILNALQATWRAPRAHEDFRYFVSAAAPLTRTLASAAWDRWNLRVVQGYGLTETINFSCTLPHDISESAYRRLMLDADVPSIGVSVSGNDVSVLDVDGNPAEHGRIGEICVRGHNVMDRYVGNDEETSHAFRHGWFHTGDLGRSFTDEETARDFFIITGREKNIAKVSGAAVSLEEMERKLMELPTVVDAACTALPDRVRGEAIVAALATSAELADAIVLDHLRKMFPESALPVRIVRLRMIPRTATGKLLRPQLRELLAAGTA